MSRSRQRMNSRNTRTKSVKNIILLALVLVFIVAILGNTYSKYMSGGNVDTSGEIAKWNVKIGDNNLSETQDITINARTVEGISNENVGADKIAPGQTLVADLEVNPNGTEVAVDYVLSLGEIETEGFDTNSVVRVSKVMATVDGGEGVEIPLVDGEYTYYESLSDVLAGKKVTFSAHVSWDDINNSADTANGAGAVTSVQVPVEITAKQHLAEDGYISTDSVDTVTLLEGVVGNLSSGDTLALTKDVNYEGNYAANSYHQVNFPSNFTLDLNGKKLSSTNASILFADDGLTIKNGILKGLADSYGRTYTCIWNYSAETPKKNMKLENVVADGGLNLYNVDNIVLENVTSTATKFYSIFCNEAATLTVKSGTYSTTSNSTALFGYLGQYKGEVTNPEDGFKIYGGTFNTNGKKFCLTGASGDQYYIPPVIYGGTFDCDVSAYVAEGHTCVDQGNGTWVVE